MKRLTRASVVSFAAASIVFTSVCGGAGIAHALPPSFSAEQSLDPSSLVVTPSSALFDIDLDAGEVESRVATLSNRSERDMLVSLSADVVHVEGDKSSASTITVSVASDGTCAISPSIGLLSGERLEQGTIQAGESREICITVARPSSAVGDPSVSKAHLAFDAITKPESTPTSGGRGSGLATTGDHALPWLLALGTTALISGIALIRRRTQKGGNHA